MPARWLRRTVPLCLCASVPACFTDARTTLTVTNWAAWNEQRLEQAHVRQFEADRPGVRVSLTSAPNGPEYRDLVLTSIAAGTPPDVFLMDNIDVPAFVRAGVALDLAPYLPRVGLAEDDFDPRVLAIFRREGALVAVPKGFTPMLVAYNRDVFDRAGVPYPRDDWTWEEFRAAARALTRDTDGDGAVDQWGFWFDRRVFMWIPWLWSLGGDVLCADGRRASGCLDAPASVRAFRELTALATRDSVTPRFFGLRRSIGDQLRTFYSGRVAMVTVGHFWLPAIRPHVEAGRLRVGFAMIPHAADVAPATVLYASGYAVPRTVRHKRLSVELAAWMADSAAQATRAAGLLEIPALASVSERIAREDTLGWEAAFTRAVPFGREPWGARVEAWREVEAILPDIMDRVIMRGEDVAAVLRDVARRVDAVLEGGRAGERTGGRAAR
jgi:multiple sugar transport system substrate-binding protein